jgi:hypothetical protein
MLCWTPGKEQFGVRKSFVSISGSMPDGKVKGMSKRKFSWILAGMALCAAVGGTLHLEGCNEGMMEECACTAEFRSFTAVVVDGTGAPVDSAEIREMTSEFGARMGIPAPPRGPR